MARSSATPATRDEEVMLCGSARLLRFNDPLLAPLIVAETDAMRNNALERLIVGHARRVIALVLARHHDHDFLAEDSEDLAATVVVRLVRRLQAAAVDEEKAIASLSDYTATLTYNVVHDALRERFPEWTRLKNRVRYVMTHDVRLRMDGQACALAEWRASRPPAHPPPGVADRRWSPQRLGDATAAILAATGAPVLVNELVRVLAEAFGIAEATRTRVTVEESCPAHDSLELRVESRQYLVALWREIVALRDAQRAALLLNLRDADQQNALALFVRVGVASIDAVAAAAGLTVAHLAAIWNDLPLDDLRIAARLGVSRQQVINLRKAARARLARRMRRP